MGLGKLARRCHDAPKDSTVEARIAPIFRSCQGPDKAVIYFRLAANAHALVHTCNTSACAIVTAPVNCPARDFVLTLTVTFSGQTPLIFTTSTPNELYDPSGFQLSDK